MNKRRGIKFQITKRIEANRQRAADVLPQEERERETLRQLNREANEPGKNSIPQKLRY